MRPPLSLERMHWTEGAREVAYTLKPKEGQPGAQERLDPLDFVARLLAHVPEPRLHLAHYYGWYSNVSRGRRRKGKDANLATTPSSWHEADGLSPAERRARRQRWAQLVRRVYEVDPLVCPKCGGKMRIISVILDPAVIATILEHLRRKTQTPVHPQTPRPRSKRRRDPHLATPPTGPGSSPAHHPPTRPPPGPVGGVEGLVGRFPPRHSPFHRGAGPAPRPSWPPGQAPNGW